MSLISSIISKPSKSLDSSSSENESLSDQQEDDLSLFGIVISPDGEGICLRLQPVSSLGSCSTA